MTTILVGPRSTKDAITGMRIAFDLLVLGFGDRFLAHVIINRSEGIASQGNSLSGRFIYRPDADRIRASDP